jgi:glycine oxidase
MEPVNGSPGRGAERAAAVADRLNLIRVMPAKGWSSRGLSRRKADAVVDKRSSSDPGDPLPASAEVAVVGGGLAGLICAWALAREGAEVVVFDDAPERPPAASVAAGMIAPVGEASWGEEQQLPAALAAADAWPAFARELEAAAGMEVPYRRCGSVHVALDRDEAVELDRRQRLHRRLGLEARVLLPSECRRLEPGLATAVTKGVEVPGEAEVDPRALLDGLVAAAGSAGVELRTGRVERVAPGSGRVELTGGRSLQCERVVLAAGAWAGEGLVGGEVALPVRPVRGEILRLRAQPEAMPCERIVVTERLYLVPRRSGEVVVGATVEERGFELGVSAGGVHELLREAYRTLPELAELEFIEAAAGLRPGTPDNAPIVGRVGGGPVIAVCGLYRHGVLLAPLLGPAVTALAGGGEVAAELEGLGPGRFAGAGKVVA